MRIAKFSALLAALVMAFSVVTANAASVAPTFVAGNPACADGTKIEPVADGTYAISFSGFAGTITIDVRQTAQGPVFDFDTDSADHLVTSVTVKGGPNANLYTYPNGVSSDDGLHSPLNPNNGKWYGLSHLCFDVEKKA